MSRTATLSGEAPGPGWQGILDPGERILWQGQPDSRPHIGLAEIKSATPGLMMSGFALIWMLMAAQASLLFAMFGLLFLGKGVLDVAQRLILPSFTRSRSWYTLTDRRAIVATDLPFQGRRLKSWPIGPASPVEYVASEPPSVLFGPETIDRRERAGFHFIPEADRVMTLLRQIQSGQAATAPEEGFR